MKKLLMALVIVGLSAGAADASILGNLLTFNGVVDTLLDQSRANVVDNPGGVPDGVYSVGDVIYGYVAVDQADPESDGLGLISVTRPDELVFLFSAEVNSIVVDGGTIGVIDPGDVVDHKATTVANYRITDLVDPAFVGSIVNAASTIFVTVEGTPTLDALDESMFTSLSDFNPTNLFSYVANGGLGVPNDFMHVQYFDSGSFFGQEQGGFTMFNDTLGMVANSWLLPVSVGRLDGLAPTQHDVTLFNGYISRVSGGTSVWDLTDNSDFQINAIPEPGAMAIWGLFASLGGICAWRRRKRA